jgi:hypothetical protein
MPVGVMLRSMSARELQEWRVIWSHYEVFGDDRADLRHGIACQLLHEVNRGKGKRKKPADFMPFSRKRNKVTDPQDIAKVFQMFT